MERFLSCDRYMNGAATNPDCHVLAYAGAQVKKGLDIAKKLGAENFGMTYIVLIPNMRLSFKFCSIVFNPVLLPSSQCFGEVGKVSTPSLTLTLPLS